MEKEYYQELYSKCGDILSECFEEEYVSIMRKNHHYLLDINKWLEAIDGRYEKILLESACQEYQYSLLSLLQGQYRHSFMSLRLFFELTLSSIYFSSNEYEFRLWTRNEKDINWKQLVDKQKGVLSKSFIRVFFEDIADESVHFQTIAEKVYRECSEYVHGNAKTYELISNELKFSDEIFRVWHEKSTNIYFVVLFALCSRYLGVLDKVHVDKLESMITDELSHLSAIQAFFSSDLASETE